MEIVDTRGELCPKPLIMTKKMLNTLKSGEEFQILTDNDTALSNLKMYLTDSNIKFEVEKNSDHYLIKAVKSDISVVNQNAEMYCSSSNPAYTIVFRSNRMGVGEDELGEILIKGFINTLNNLESKPECLIFYNSSVLLTTNDSPVLPALKELSDGGCEILICGTCADYYKIKDQISIGCISNMLSICEKLTAAGKLIYP
jgi:selenium metabolism protein YedF